MPPEFHQAFQQETMPDVRELPKHAPTNSFLQGISQSVRDSRPFEMNLAIAIRRNDQEHYMGGWYGQVGQKLNQSRMVLNFIAGQNRFESSLTPFPTNGESISQICDGRFLYTLVQNQEDHHLEFIDLRKIQEVREGKQRGQHPDPTNWIATGGLASLIENLSLAFEFIEPQVREIDGLQVCRVDGIWRSEDIRELLNGQVAEDQLAPEIVWHQLPPQLPHQVSLTLVHNPDLGWLPSKLHYFQFEKTKKHDDPSDSHRSSLRLVGLFYFSHPKPLSISAEQLIQIDSGDIETIDATHHYVHQIYQIELDRQAKSLLEGGDSILR